MSKDSQSAQAELAPVKRAIAELRRMKAKLDAVEAARSEKIAIVGMGMRLPGGVVDARSYWKLLEHGVDAITEVPSERWQIDDYFDPDPDAPGKMYTRHGGFLDRIDRFDTDFFRISPREAVAMDPQQRLLLEVTWEALENAAIAPSSLVGSRSGVFIGFSNSDYAHTLVQDEDRIDAYTGTGYAACVAAGRLSYVLGLTGPSMVVDTACSSSLSAIAQANQSLRRGDCNLAVAGGVNLILSPEMNIAFSKARMMAVDGRCKTFDARADGYVRGEGCAVLVLKRLSDAERDGDPIIALVSGVAVNQDGASSGLTVPSGPSQEAVVRAALADASVEAADVDYIEAHGTGTSLGDPIEMHALGAVFAPDRPVDQPLVVGSVKTNIGHLEAAAGIAGVAKVALSLGQAQIPANLHFTEPSPQIDWERCPFKVPTALMQWPEKSGARTAGVSSFGFSGTNAHVILEQAPTRPEAPAPREPAVQVLCLSAVDRTPLRGLAGQFAECLREPGNALADVAHTANTGRSSFSHRLAVLGETRETVAERLALFAGGEEPGECLTGVCPGTEAPQVAFLFTGQGAQYVGMGRQLYESQSVFRASMDRCDEILRGHRAQGLLAALYDDDADPSRLEQTDYAQPAMFAIEVSLAGLWRSWGLEPSVVLGHSVGEYAAACVAGVFSLEDGLRLTAERGRLMQATSQAGGMAAVFADAEACGDLLEDYAGRVVVAALNSPENTVLSGESAALSELLGRLDEAGIASHRLEVSHAFHSPLIEPALAPFEKVARSVDYSAPIVDMVSGASGKLVSDDLMHPDYWVAQSREPVRFRHAVDTLVDTGCRLIVEVGPHPTLLTIGQACRPDDGLVWIPSIRRQQDDRTQLAESVARLYVNGIQPNWDMVQPGGRRRGGLPTYPFERESYWWTSKNAKQSGRNAARPSVDSVLDAARAQADLVPIDLRVETYARKWDCLNRLARAYIARTLTEVGAFPQLNAIRNVEDILTECGIQDTYRMLLGRWLEHLADDAKLTRCDGGFSRVLPEDEPIEPALSSAREALDDIPVMLEYVERSGHLLTQVVRGEETALETLFPGGSSRTANWLYRESALSRYFNNIAAAVVAAFARDWPKDQTLRLLEVGAGTGATTESIVRQLPADQSVYAFTDISDFFLSQAKERFAAYPFLRYGLLDLEQDPEAQGFERDSFDVIVAANVLHATKNLDETLAHVRSLLASDGLLVLIEVTDPPLWYDVSVSLIEGWQRFEDGHRTDSPLLPASSWTSLLGTAGFEAAEALPGEQSAATVLGTRVIVARVPSAEGATAGVRLPSAMTVGQTAVLQCGASRTDDESSSESAQVYRERIVQAPDNERHELLVDLVGDRINRVLRRNPDKPLDRRQNLMDLGLDSLMAVELRDRLTSALLLEDRLPATLIFDYPNMDAVAAYLEDQLVPKADTLHCDQATSCSAINSPPMTREEIENLSDEAVEAMLNARLDKDFAE